VKTQFDTQGIVLSSLYLVHIIIVFVVVGTKKELF